MNFRLFKFFRCLFFLLFFLTVLSFSKPFFTFYFLQKNKDEAVFYCGEGMVNYISVSGYGCKSSDGE